MKIAIYSVVHTISKEIVDLVLVLHKKICGQWLWKIWFLGLSRVFGSSVLSREQMFLL